MLIILPILSLSLSACAVISSGNGSSAPSAATASYPTMESLPPAPKQEDQPQLADKEVWVPGYYEPLAGAWIWHSGKVTAEKAGYRLVPATYTEESGKVYFNPPRWRRADLANK
jgi:hypothetical protein